MGPLGWLLLTGSSTTWSRSAGFSYAAGVHALSTSIWCDAARARGVCFVSRGDVAIGRGRADRLIATERTVAIRAALGLPCADPLLPRLGRPFALGRARLELLPSGRLPGAAQLLIELAGWRGLYAGAIAPSAIGGAEPLQVRACDELILDAPQAGGVVDGMCALDRAIRGEDPVFTVGDAAAMLAIAAYLGSSAIVLGTRWRRLARLFPALRSQGRTRTRRASSIRIEAEPRRGAPGIEVRVGMRRPEETDVIALGLLPDAGAVVSFVADTAARLVQLRLPRKGTLEITGARTLIDALAARGTPALVLGPPEQLSLFP